jgi:hypothetical protein
MIASQDVERLGSRGSNQVKRGPRGTQVGSNSLKRMFATENVRRTRLDRNRRAAATSNQSTNNWEV